MSNQMPFASDCFDFRIVPVGPGPHIIILAFDQSFSGKENDLLCSKALFRLGLLRCAPAWVECGFPYLFKCSDADIVGSFSFQSCYFFRCSSGFADSDSFIAFLELAVCAVLDLIAGCLFCLFLPIYSNVFLSNGCFGQACFGRIDFKCDGLGTRIVAPKDDSCLAVSDIFIICILYSIIRPFFKNCLPVFNGNCQT